MTREGSLLLVDDNEMNRDALSRRLHQRGFAVTVAADGPEALRLADSTTFDLVLLDVEMPRLKIEITESAFLGDLKAAQFTLQRVQAMGIEWSLDDFGTGYSSLSHLHRLKVDTVKIDRSFVSRIGAADDKGSEMVRAIVALGHNLGMDVVAEGVETMEQLAYLRALGCEQAQGFFFSKPVPTAEAGSLIAAQPWRGLRGSGVAFR